MAADRGCGVVLGGVTCVSGRQKELLETPERWAEIFAEKHFGGTGNDLVGGCSTVTIGPWRENISRARTTALRSLDCSPWS